MTTGAEKARRDAQKGRIRVKEPVYTADQLQLISQYLVYRGVECQNAINALLALAGDSPLPGQRENIMYWSNIQSGVKNWLNRIYGKIGIPHGDDLQGGPNVC